MLDIERRKRSRTRGRDGGSRPRPNNYMDYTQDGGSTTVQETEIVSISLKNSGGILSRRSPRTMGCSPIDDTYSSHKKTPSFVIGANGPPASSKNSLMQPVLKQVQFKSPLLSMKKYPQHVLKRVIKDDRGASLKNSGRNFDRHCVAHTMKDRLNMYRGEPRHETNPLMGGT